MENLVCAMTRDPVQYPNMRAELVDCLQILVSRDVTHLDYAIHFLLDDTPLMDAPQDAIGLFLKNEDELATLKPVLVELMHILRRYGRVGDDARYVAAPEWASVTQAAQVALNALRE